MRPAHSLHLANIYAACINLTAILIDVVQVASRRIVQLPTVPVSAALTIHEACGSSRRFIFAIVLAAGSLTAILINVVFIVSCCKVQLPTVPVSAAVTIHKAC